jgi:hypothetical protein
MNSERVMCPSAPCEPGAVLLGIVVAEGQVAYARDRIVVDEEFVQIARAGRSPEKRFRFSAPCVRGACRQWTGSRCGVIDAVIEVIEPRVTAPLPPCSIRSQCRWFAQSGSSACAVCPAVMTDNA